MKTIVDFAPQLEKALAYTDTHTLSDVANALREGDAQLWVQDDAVIITQIDVKPQAKHLLFWLAAGELDDVLLLAQRVYAWGRVQGCDKAVMTGRKGWLKALADHGWEPRTDLVLMEKAL